MLTKVWAAETGGAGGNGAEQGDEDAAKREAQAQDPGDDDGGDEDDEDDQGEHVSAKELKALRAEATEAKKMRANHERIMSERRKLSDFVKRINKLGPIEEIEKKLAAQVDEEVDKASKSGDHERTVKALTAKFQGQLDEKEATIADQRKMIEELTIDIQLRAALIENKIEPMLLDGAFELHRKRMRLNEDDEEEGIARLKVVAKFDDDLVPVRDYVKNWTETDEKARAYLIPPVNAGGNASQGKRGDYMRKSKAKMTIAEKSQFIEKHGLDAYQKLPA